MEDFVVHVQEAADPCQLARPLTSMKTSAPSLCDGSLFVAVLNVGRGGNPRRTLAPARTL
jgi:hypothetical protein